MTLARWTLVSAMGAGLATACLLPGIETTGSEGSGAPGSGASGSGATGGGDALGCDPPCDDPSECGQSACTDGVCGFVKAGTPTDGQVEGDCRVEVCTGDGGITSEPDDTDAPTAAVCTTTSCQDGRPLVMDARDGTECGQGLACLGGVCSGCQTARDCGPPVECTHFACTNPGPQGACTVFDDDVGTPCGPGPTCTSTAELTTYTCNGRGSCVGTNASCDPNVCSGDACTTGCTASFGCAPGAVCMVGFCQDCRTCNEWYFLTDRAPACALAMTLQQLLYDCACLSSSPCQTTCGNSLCGGLSPQGDDDCVACLLTECPTQLSVCTGDADPVP